MSIDVKKLTPTELVALKYDLAVDLYRRRAKALEVEAAAREGKWLPYYVYKIFGQNLLLSLALALNPKWSIDPAVQKFSNQRVPGLYPNAPVAANRTRRRTVGSPGIIRTRYTVYGTIDGTHLAWTGSGWDYPANPTTYFPTNGTVYYEVGTQFSWMEWIKDTTWKSRNPNVSKIPHDLKDRRALELNELGECESFDSKFHTPSNQTTWSTFDHSWNDFWDSRLITDIKGTYTVAFEHGSASVDPDTVQLSIFAERNHAFDEMATHLDQMIARCLPARRSYNAFYQIGELKDLPQTLRGSLTAWKDVQSLMGSKAFVKALKSPKFWTRQNILAYRDALARCSVYLDPDKELGSAYLTYKFGWESMYQAVDQLVRAPSKATKDINYLLGKNGQNVTLSTIVRLPDSDWPSHPAITPYIAQPMLPDPDDTYNESSTRSSSIRCCVNSGVHMPALDVPILRGLLYTHKLGLIPLPSDILNLIPWTWLIDWFQGLSDYVRLAEEVQLDRSIINWGMATYRSDLSATASIGAFMLYNKMFVHNASGSVHNVEVAKATLRGEGTFKASYKLRVGIQNLAQVKLSSGYRLSDTQKIILAALASTRSGPARRSSWST